jgi:hypothetical protein
MNSYPASQSVSILLRYRNICRLYSSSTDSCCALFIIVGKAYLVGLLLIHRLPRLAPIEGCDDQPGIN